VVVCSRFHGCDIGACIAKSETSKDVFDVSLLFQGDGLVLEIASDTDSEKPVDATKINKLEVLVQLSFGLGREFARVGDNGKIIRGSSDYQESIAVDLVKGCLISDGDFEAE